MDNEGKGMEGGREKKEEEEEGLKTGRMRETKGVYDIGNYRYTPDLFTGTVYTP